MVTLTQPTCKIEEVIYHTRAVARGVSSALIVADLPIHSYDSHELAVQSASSLISAGIGIPTIGIGSGLECDGQILVFHDLVGYFPWFTPKHARPESDLAAHVRRAVRAYVDRTRRGM